MFNFVTMYYRGDGTEKDLSRAFELYSKVADTGDRNALFMVDKTYFEGLGVEKDQGKGFKFFGRAAAAGNRLAQELVGDIRRGQSTWLIRIDRN